MPSPVDAATAQVAAQLQRIGVQVHRWPHLDRMLLRKGAAYRAFWAELAGGRRVIVSLGDLPAEVAPGSLVFHLPPAVTVTDLGPLTVALCDSWASMSCTG